MLDGEGGERDKVVFVFPKTRAECAEDGGFRPKIGKSRESEALEAAVREHFADIFGEEELGNFGLRGARKRKEGSSDTPSFLFLHALPPFTLPKDNELLCRYECRNVLLPNDSRLASCCSSAQPFISGESFISFFAQH